MNLHPKNPANMMPNTMIKNALPGYTPPYHQLAAAILEPTASLSTWQRVPFTSGDSISYRSHKIYSERRKPQGSSTFERRYPVKGPLVSGTFGSVAAAKAAIAQAEDLQKEQASQAQESAKISRAGSSLVPTSVQQPTTVQPPRTVTRTVIRKETSAPEVLSTTHAAARAPVDTPDPRVQVSSTRSTQASPVGPQEKKTNPLLIAAIIGIPIIVGTMTT